MARGFYYEYYVYIIKHLAWSDVSIFYREAPVRMIRIPNFGENPTGSCYNNAMENKRLSETNPYLRDKAKRKVGLFMSVCSSSAIEGIAAEGFINEYLSRKAKQTTGHKTAKSGQRHS